MPSETYSLRVEETGELGVYLVESKSDPKNPYRVNLCERIHEDRAHGVCNCTWFQTNANKNFERTKKHQPYRQNDQGKVVEGATECKHIRAALNHAEYYLLMPLFAKMKNGIPKQDQ